MTSSYALSILTESKTGILRDIGAACADINANIVSISQETPDVGLEAGHAILDLEVDFDGDISILIKDIQKISGVLLVKLLNTAKEIFGKRVIVIGGGAQVAQVAMGAVNEADRHNIRGERISVDTIPLVGEENLAEAIEAVTHLPRTAILVLAGSIMGGEITNAIRIVQAKGIPVICLKMAGSASSIADLVVTDPIQAGVMAVMHVSDIGVFDIARVRGKEY